jgi:hypothetical protein
MTSAESDRFFTDSIYAVANVLVGNSKYPVHGGPGRQRLSLA